METFGASCSWSRNPRPYGRGHTGWGGSSQESQELSIRRTSPSLSHLFLDPFSDLPLPLGRYAENVPAPECLPQVAHSGPLLRTIPKGVEVYSQPGRCANHYLVVKTPTVSWGVCGGRFHGAIIPY